MPIILHKDHYLSETCRRRDVPLTNNIEIPRPFDPHDRFRSELSLIEVVLSVRTSLIPRCRVMLRQPDYTKPHRLYDTPDKTEA